MENVRHMLIVSVIGLPLTWIGCATTGTATGELKNPATKEEEPVALVWKSEADHPERGEISGTLPSGKHYSGHYFEVMDQADLAIYAPAWEGWDVYWAGWPWQGSAYIEDWPGFVRIYSGKVIANMHADSGEGWLRCRFNIDEPTEGLVDGGNGECQLSDGETIQHVVLRPS